MTLGATPAIIVALVAGFTVWHTGKAHTTPVADPSNCRLVNAKEALSGFLGNRCWAVWAAPGANGPKSAVFTVVVGGPDHVTTVTPVDSERTTPLAVCANGVGTAADGSQIEIVVYRLGSQAAKASESENGRKTSLPLFSDGGTLFAVLSAEFSDDISVTAEDSSGKPLASLTSAAVWNVGDATTHSC